jgi:hypothetical protein
MYLYQQIMNVPGLTGTWQQRNAQYYKALGSPLGKYTGSLQQNLYLLDQIKKKNFPQVKASTPTAPAAPAVNPGAQAGQEMVPQTPWGEVMPWEQFFDENLAKSGAAQRSARYFDPLVQRAQEGIQGEYATRGLSRSGQRGRSVLDMYKGMADEEASMREQLYGTQEGEARQNYGFQQGLYEESPKGYQATPHKMDPYEYQYPEESAQRYSQSYRDWLRSAYKI